jgi:hypothetical protein
MWIFYNRETLTDIPWMITVKAGAQEPLGHKNHTVKKPKI